MIIQLEHINNSPFGELFISTRKRLACATSVKLIDAERMLVCNLVGQRMYLIRYDIARGTHRIESCIATQFGGKDVVTDLMDFDGRESIVVSNCGLASVSLYRLARNRLSFVKDVPINDPEAGFCHGVKFVPPHDDVICATCVNNGRAVYFVSAATGEVLYKFSDGEWKPKDVCFIDAERMVVLYARGRPTPELGTAYESKTSLVRYSITARQHEVLDEIITEECHVDCCQHSAGCIYVNNQTRDALMVFRLDGNRLVMDREIGGYNFPHGIDLLPAANLLAVTNYGDNTVALGPIPPSGPLPLHGQSRVLAVVTHYHYEQWLEQCLASLVAQTRPPEAIVVLDDGSSRPPVDLVRTFPQVTLLASRENVGPYRLLQQVVDCTDYDAYLIQDADDWSTPDRLDKLLAEAEATGAEALGSQATHVLCEEGLEEQIARPLNANAAYAADPAGHYMTFGTSIIARGLLCRLGGLATGLRFGADGEFFRRARHVARLINVPEACYFRRKHPDALTQRHDTGMQSSARKALRGQLLTRALENAAAAARGETPDLAPFSVAEPVALVHVCGPQLRDQAQPARLTVPSRKSPVFIVGMHRSGTSLMANLLRQGGLWLGGEDELHGPTSDNPDGHWESIAVTELNDAVLGALGGGWDDVPERPAGWLEQLSSPAERARAIHAGLARPTTWGWKDPRASLLMPFWLTLEPTARVVICVRNPLEVAHSLRTRGMMSYTLGLKLWRRYNERLLADVPPAQRIVIHYEHCVMQPRRALRRVADFCGLRMSDSELNQTAAAARPELRHARFTAAHLVRTAVAPEIVALYAQLCAEAGWDDAPPPPVQDAPRSARQVDLDALAYELNTRRWRGWVQKHTPVGARIAVVSKGDDELLRLDQREPWHFPGDGRGRYLGYHPADDAEALAHLGAARAAGVQFLALPECALWWLDFYPEFRRHLESTFTRLEVNPRIGVIYHLGHSPWQQP